MEWVEVTGRTIEEAKDAALDQLGVDESEAEFEVVQEPKAGLFGRLRAEARVRARVQPTAVRPKIDRGSRRRGRKERTDEPKEAATGAAATAPPPAPEDSSPAAADNRRPANGGGSRGGTAPTATRAPRRPKPTADTAADKG
ncbi:MAG: Jag N-terminal domain-containing protein, partial [Acidimicrobiales bacterium]